MDVNQIYSLVNSVCAQAYGENKISVTDGGSLVSLGNRVFASNADSELFLRTMTWVIGKTIYAYRGYRNKLSDMVLDDFQYGAIMQKVSVQLADAQSDPAYKLENGKSVDQWVVNKPAAVQKLFASVTPYMFSVSISKKLLKGAFHDAAGMARLISTIMGQMRNSIELSLENLGRATMGNFMAEMVGTPRVIDVLTEYNTASGKALTAADAFQNDEFLRYTLGRIQNVSKSFTDMSQRWNDGSITRHTPIEMQRLRIYAPLETAIEKTVQYRAYYKDLVDLGVYKELNFWQSNNAGEELDVSVKRASDGATVNLKNVIALLHDRDAMGIYKKEEEVEVTPLNAFGLYYNTAWHEEQLWFNDLSEQGVLFVMGAQADPVPTSVSVSDT